MVQQKRSYRERSRGFLVKAREELAAGDLEQAAEKGWGAAATIMKAFADQNGLDHERHSQLFPVLRAVINKSSDREIRRLFGIASGLHINFYEDSMTAEEVGEDLDAVERFVEKVEALL